MKPYGVASVMVLLLQGLFLGTFVSCASSEKSETDAPEVTRSSEVLETAADASLSGDVIVAEPSMNSDQDPNSNGGPDIEGSIPVDQQTRYLTGRDLRITLPIPAGSENSATEKLQEALKSPGSVPVRNKLPPDIN